jgi:integrase
MSVYTHDNSPYWQFDFQHHRRRFFGSFDGQDGRPQIPKERPKRDAEGAEAVIKAQLSASPDKKPRMTLGSATEHYWNVSAKHQAGSAGEWGHICDLRRIMGANIFMDEIDDAACSRFVAKRRTETARHKDTLVANGTVNNGLECLGRTFKSVRKIARMPADPPDISAHKLPEPKERVRSLTTDEQTRLFAAVDKLRPDFRDMIEFALLTGKRLSEVIFIEKTGIDRRARFIRVVQKGGQEIAIQLTARTLAIVERNWMHHPTRLFTYSNQANKVYVQKGATVAVRKGTRRPFTKDGWRKQWAAILEEAKVSDFRFHDLRHTAGTRILAATGNLKAVQRALDHASIASSARYAHLDPGQKTAALEAAERLGVPERSRKSRKQKGDS